MSRFPIHVLVLGLFVACKGPATDTDTGPATPTPVPSEDTGETSRPGPPYDLTVIGQGYEGANGQMVRARMADDDLILVGEETDIIEGGGWQVRFRDVVRPVEPGYYVAWWIDLDLDGECAEGDIAYLETVASAISDQIRTHTFNANGIDPEACAGF